MITDPMVSVTVDRKPKKSLEALARMYGCRTMATQDNDLNFDTYEKIKYFKT